MAFANLFSTASSARPAQHRPEEEHIGSGANTPPAGVQTPQPDLSDKRLPGILSSYFSQVCLPSHISSLAASAPRVSLSPHSPCAATTSSMTDSAAAAPDAAIPLGPAATQHVVALPLPSNASVELASDQPATAAEMSAMFIPALRSHTLTTQALSQVTTTPHVLAAHFSNPGLSTSPSTPLTPFAPPAASSSSTPNLKPLSLDSVSKLTVELLDQNTPPQTPRSRSHNSRTSQARSSNGSSTTHKDVNAVAGEHKGKLSVTILEGRGLKPSLEPYVVCQFQLNEYISKGPRPGPAAEPAESDEHLGAVPMRRATSDMGRPMAIPMKSRQSSHTSISSHSSAPGTSVTDPVWDHTAIFDVVGDNTQIDVSVYDHFNRENFLGHVRLSHKLAELNQPMEQWFKLEPRSATSDTVSGDIRLKLHFQEETGKKHYGPEDFKILKLIGKGTFGQVFQVRKYDTHRVYAMKVLSKKVIVQKREVAHTLGERNILVRTAMTDSPFIVGLKFSFQTPTDLYLVTDYMSGGELFWHLQKEGRFQEPRAKFYIAELILALQHLHVHDIVYRDLKPENILLDANGHIALCDFGLSKANLARDDTTQTFCGTTEYLAPEVLLDENGYGKMVDFWSLGVLVFEMCCGWSPFYAEDTQQMYKNIAFGKVRFPRDALSTEGRNFVKGLLNRNPRHRLGANGDAEELKAHPFFADIDWDKLGKKMVVPPFKPRLKSETDTSNFDPEFTNALDGGSSSLNVRAQILASGIDNATTPLSPTMQANFKGFTFVDESSVERNMRRSQVDEDTVMWDEGAAPGRGEPGDRMSGITRTVTGGHGGPEDGMFSAEGF